MKLWYKSEGTNFGEALPIGNGSLGGMVYGGTTAEKITINHDTLWSGSPRDTTPKNSEGAMDEIKDLLKKGDRKGAARVVWKKIMSDYTAVYSVAGDLVCSFDVQEATDYYRELDMDSGIVSVSYKNSAVECKREYFCSYPDKVMPMHFTAASPSLCGKFGFECPHPNTKIEVDDNTLYITSKMPYLNNEWGDAHLYDENKPSVSFCIALRLINKDGELLCEEDGISFKNCSELTVFLCLETDFLDYKTNPHGDKQLLKQNCKVRLDNLPDYEVLKQRHIKDFTELMGRTTFSIDGIKREDLPTDLRISHNARSRDDVGITELLFAYGRYMLISSSRKGSQAANLQGIWNEELTPPWSSGYTININLPMNYWPAESTGLGVCHTALFELLKDLSVKGQKTAAVYGCRGWCTHHNSDLWRHTTMIGGRWDSEWPGTAYACWPFGGAWLTYHIWEHYLYTKDKEFLKEYFDVLRGNALFLYDFLTENEQGYLVPTFDSSPENTYWYKGEKIAIAQGSTMSMGIIKASFESFVSACEDLGVEDELKEQIIIATPKLLPFGVDKDGMILEWDKDFERYERAHRHLSPLWAFHPANLITPEKTPELIEPVKKMLEERAFKGAGWQHSWRACISARLYDGDRAYMYIKNMSRHGTNGEERRNGNGMLSNLFLTDPPFQADGNYGVTAAICEILLQSHRGFVELLPTLPHEWPTGSIKGIMARGGFNCDIKWENHKLQTAKITAMVDGTLKLKVKDKWCVTSNGKKHIANDGFVSMDLIKGQEVEINA